MSDQSQQAKELEQRGCRAWSYDNSQMSTMCNMAPCCCTKLQFDWHAVILNNDSTISSHADEHSSIQAKRSRSEQKCVASQV